jgi:hypothetical protein
MVLTINVPVVYMALDVIILMQATSISRAIGRGELVAISGPKKVENV